MRKKGKGRGKRGQGGVRDMKWGGKKNEKKARNGRRRRSGKENTPFLPFPSVFLAAPFGSSPRCHASGAAYVTSTTVSY